MDILVYKSPCKTCQKNTFSLNYASICLSCGGDPETIVLENPIESVIKGKHLIITKSFGVLDARTYKNSDILHIGKKYFNYKGIYHFL